MSKHIKIKLQFSKDFTGLSLQDYINSKMQIIITNLYYKNRCVILDKETIEDIDFENNCLTVKIEVNNYYTQAEYNAAGIRLIMNAPLAFHHPSYFKAKKIYCTYSFNEGDTSTKNGVMYDSGTNNKTKWHFTIKSQSTQEITENVIQRLADKKYHKGKLSAQIQANNFSNDIDAQKKYERENYLLYAVTLTFETSTLNPGGTDAIFGLSIFNKTFHFNTENHKQDKDDDVFPIDGYLSLFSPNWQRKKEGFKCRLFTKSDSGAWLDFRDDGHRFEKGTEDKIVIILPKTDDEKRLRFGDFVQHPISLWMHSKNGHNFTAWKFDWCEVALFKYYTEDNLEDDEQVSLNDKYTNIDSAYIWHNSGNAKERHKYKDNSEFMRFEGDTGKHKGAVDFDDRRVIFETQGAFPSIDNLKDGYPGALQYSRLRSKIAKIEDPILKNYRKNNYIMHSIAFTFRTHEEVHSGTNAVFKISVFGESFLFNTKTGEITESNFEGKIVSFIHGVDKWGESKDKIFEERSLDKILIKLPENTYSYNDFVATDVKLKMVDTNGDGPGWKFEFCYIDLFKEEPDPKANYFNYKKRCFINNADNNFGDKASGFIYFDTPPVHLHKAYSLLLLLNADNQTLYNGLFDTTTKENFSTDPETKYRIEPYVRNINEDKINNALAMAIHDPLWLLARQWQFGEFEGNDAGSVILAKLKAKKAKINKLYNLDKPSQVTNIEDMPLEPLVEALPIEIDWQVRVESAAYFLSMLQFNENIETNSLARLKSELLSYFPLENSLQESSEDLSPEEHLQQLKNSCKTDVQAYAAHYQNRIFDGYKLYQWCANNITKPRKNWELLQNGEEIPNMLKEYMAWFEKKHHIEPNTYWKPEGLNYRFGVQSSVDNTNLVADNYDSGKLSWFSFEDNTKTTLTQIPTLKKINIANIVQGMQNSLGNIVGGMKNSLGNIIEGVKQSKQSIYNEKLFTFIPTMAQYPGMPKKRLWELESGTVEMGVTTGVGVKHYANALILQYATMYANDWMMLPMELDISTITEVDKILLTNVFGDRILIRTKDEANPNERFMNNWDMFSLSRKDPYLNNNFSSDNRMLYPPALYNGMESEPIEEIQFLRDEMSNMIWGVENIINQGCGISLDGKHFAAALEEKIEEQNTKLQQQQNNATDTQNANYTYTLQNTVPANWIPFIPVRMKKGTAHYEREIRLQRAKMPIYLDNKYVAMQPNTSFLQSGLKGKNYAPLFINEEEIDAVGTKLIKTYQRMRWIGGKIFTWTGYKKQLSGTQANSGLKFDKLEEIKKNEK